MTKKNLSQKILASRLLSGNMLPGGEITIRADQALLHDGTAAMVFLNAAELGLEQAKPLAVSYCDHSNYEASMLDHGERLYISSFAQKHGISHSLPGNGICHELHLQRFAEPGGTLAGADFHSTMLGAAAMFSVAAGPLEMAAILKTGEMTLAMPEITGVHLKGQLQPWVAPKDIVLWLLWKLGVEGARGKVLEFYGDGIKKLTVPDRACVCNMCAELGATAALFPSDSETKKFFSQQGREDKWMALQGDKGAEYASVIEVELDRLEPMVARPHSPGNVCKVSEIEGLKVSQVCVGSCGNSSYYDLASVAAVLEGKRVHPTVSMTVTPASRQVLSMMAEGGALAGLISSGARMLECACGPCAGLGHAPTPGSVSLRSFNRNYQGMFGTPDAKAFIASPLVCAAAALAGEITDPRKLGDFPKPRVPKSFPVDDAMIIAPADAEAASKLQVKTIPELRPLPETYPVTGSLTGRALAKLDDNFSADQMVQPAVRYFSEEKGGEEFLKRILKNAKPDFYTQLKANYGQWIIIAGENFGLGSSREDFFAALNAVGLRAVIARSFSRLGRSNMINCGILPLTFADPEDFRRCDEGDTLSLGDILKGLREGFPLSAENTSKGFTFGLKHSLSPRELDIAYAGGRLKRDRQAGQK